MPVKDAPVRAVRAAVAGVGRVLKVKDRMSAKSAAPAPEAPAEPKAQAATEPSNVRVLEPEAASPETEASADLPLANYDTLTVASLRARLRNLSPGQLSILIDYEKAHAGREEVVGMYERRIAKIKAGETTSFQAVK